MPIPKRSTLRTRLVLSFLAVALIPLTLLGLVNKATTSDILTQNANQALFAAARQTALGVDAALKANLDAIRVDARLPTLSRYLEMPTAQRRGTAIEAEVSAILSALLQRDPMNVLSYGLFDRQGRLAFGTTVMDKNAAQTDYFQQALKTGSPYISPIRLSKAPRGVPSFYFSSPVRNTNGAIVGVLAVRQNANAIQHLIEQNNGLAGQESFAILLDENYIRLGRGTNTSLLFKSIVPLPPELARALQADQRLPNLPPSELSTHLYDFERYLQHADCPAEQTCPPVFGATSMAGTAPTSTPNNSDRELTQIAVTRLKLMPWYVVFVQSQAVFLAPISAQTQTLLLLILSIGAIVCTMAVVMSNRLTKPLVALARTVRQFTQGDLSARSLVRSQDEIGSLASSFNTMAAQVGKLLQGLEERAQELATSQYVTFAVSELFKATLDADRLLQDAVKLVQERFQVDAVWIYLWDEATQQLRVAVEAGERPQPRTIETADESLVLAAARQHKMIERPQTSDCAYAEVAVPLISRGGLLGVLNICDRQTPDFQQTDLDTFSTLAGQIATALGNAQLFNQLQKTETQFRSIFEGAPIPMAIAHAATGSLMRVNCAYLEMLGYSEAELLSLSFKELTHPEDLNQDWNQMQRLIAGEIDTYQIEKRYITKDKKLIWTNLTASLLQQTDNAHYCLGMIENITERKQAELALRHSEVKYREKAQELEQTLHHLQKAQAQLVQSEKMSSLGQLVAGIAHEINNPINFIYANLNYVSQYQEDLLSLLTLYQTYYPKPVAVIAKRAKEIDLVFLLEDFDRVIDSMKSGAERVRQIVLSLRNFSRLDETGIKLVDLHEGLNNTLLILQNQLKPQSNCPPIEVIKDYGDLPPVPCYAGQINQVFVNVLSNAIDAIYEKWNNTAVQTAPVIRIDTTVQADRAIIRIADNGIGISSTVHQKLFDPFFTTKEVGKGTGLGLSISYQIVVETHQGQLYCTSTPGEGSEFVIELPIVQLCCAQPVA